MTSVDVSVIVPTVLRPELARALVSVRESGVSAEIILVVDKQDASATQVDVVGMADRVIYTGGARGAGHARNLGLNAATAPWVAFLDDDDEFLAGKLAAQVAECVAIAKNGQRPVVSCRAVHAWTGENKLSRPIPSLLYSEGDPLEEYLFRRRRLGVDRASLFTPTLVLEADLAREVSWDETLSRHQDWDFLLRAVSVPGVVLRQLDLTGIVSWVGSAGSISAGSDWAASLDWARRWRGRWSDAVYVDFLMAQPLRYALNARSLRGSGAVVGELLGVGRVPSLQACVLGLSGLVSRRHLEAAAAAVFGRSKSMPASTGTVVAHAPLPQGTSTQSDLDRS